MLSIGTNTGAIMAQAATSSVTRDMETAMHRLSTGKRINAAADDAAGVAISSRLDSTVRGLNQSIRNALDAQALIDTAEGGILEIETILQRIRELSIQAANDTNSADDRDNLNAEVQSLLAEIDRISSSTTWAGQNLLDGTFTDKSFQVGTGTMAADQLVTSIQDFSASKVLGLSELSPQKMGNEFRINDFIDHAQHESNVIKLQNETYLVVFSGRTAQFNYGGISGQIFSSDGSPISTNFPINRTSTDSYGMPLVTAHESGGFTVVWRGWEDHYDILSQRFDNLGNMVGEQNLVVSAPRAQYPLSIIELNDGAILLSWGDAEADYGAKHQIINSDGSIRNAEFLIPDDSSERQLQPQHLALNNGGFLSIFIDDNYQLFGVRADRNGTVIGEKFFIGNKQDYRQQYAKVERLNDGGYVIVWVSEQHRSSSFDYQDGSHRGIFAQIYDADGTKRGLEITVPNTTTGDQSQPNIFAIQDGGFIITYDSDQNPNIDYLNVDYDIYGQRFSANGHKNGSEFRINSHTDNLQQFSSGVAAGNKNFIVSWTSTGQDDGSYSTSYFNKGVYAQLFKIPTMSLLNAEDARDTISYVDAALQTLNSQRASLGAISNRLDHIMANNTNAATNVSKSLGRIQDADFAAESTGLAKNQILRQASTAMLAQANASKQNILELLQS
jgi:flagellin-like hook-associated protein FlgL